MPDITYSVKDAIMACPYSLDLLKSPDRRHILVAWRTIIIVWARLEGQTCVESGGVVNRNHCAVVHGETRMLDLLNGNYDIVLKNVYNTVLGEAKNKKFSFKCQSFNEVEAVLAMEQLFFRRLNNGKRAILYPATAV